MQWQFLRNAEQPIMFYDHQMDKKEIIEKHLKQATNHAYWTGAVLGLVFGIILGLAIGYDLGSDFQMSSGK
jgi:Mg/Co/Ni transporter MgtE